MPRFKRYSLLLPAIKLREPTSRGLSAGSMNLSTSLDPADKPRDVGEENGLNLMAVPAAGSRATQISMLKRISQNDGRIPFRTG